MPVARLVRAQFPVAARRRSSSRRARSQGATPLQLVLHHILPNAIGPVIVTATIEVSAAIIAESTLSFLGLGFPPDIPTWGPHPVRCQGPSRRRHALGPVPRRRRDLPHRAVDQLHRRRAPRCARRPPGRMRMLVQPHATILPRKAGEGGPCAARSRGRVGSIQDGGADPHDQSRPRRPGPHRRRSVATVSGARWCTASRFSVAPGETVALVGESGSGKSVSALSIMRLTPRDASRTGGRVMAERFGTSSHSPRPRCAACGAGRHRHGVPGTHDEPEPGPDDRLPDRRGD